MTAVYIKLKIKEISCIPLLFWWYTSAPKVQNFKFVNMQHNSFNNMQLIYVNMRDNYVNMQQNLVTC